MRKENRKFKRFDTYMSVRYSLPEGKKEVGICLSKDLSREGMKITSPNNIPVGTLLDLEVTLPDDPKPISTTAEVVWVSKSAGEKNSFDYGLKFLMMDPVDKFRALDFAYNHWLETKINDFVDPEVIPEVNGA